MHIVPNISRGKDNLIMKFDQLIEHNINIFPQKSCRKCGKETKSRLFLFFKKALCEVKASGLQLSFNILR